VFAESFCTIDSLFFGGDFLLNARKVVALVAGINVQVVMPDILSAGRFIVLPQGDSITTISGLHRQCNDSGTFMDFGRHRRGQVIDIFKVFIRDDSYVPKVFGRIMQTHQRCNHFILKDNLANFTGSALMDNSTEWTGVSLRSMIIQAYLVYSYKTC